MIIVSIRINQCGSTTNTSSSEPRVPYSIGTRIRTCTRIHRQRSLCVTDGDDSRGNEHEHRRCDVEWHGD